MSHAGRLQRLDELLYATRELWQPQPFCEVRPGWCECWPDLTGKLLALTDAELVHRAADIDAATQLLVPYCPDLAEINVLACLPQRSVKPLAVHGERWAWEIPGRKRQQIEAFVAATNSAARPVVDWCGGKGHLGRLLALHWEVTVQTLEIDRQLCADGQALARRLGVAQDFVATDVLTAQSALKADSHAVALHACGHLHRSLLREGVAAGVKRFDVAPCCYHLGIKEAYSPLTGGLKNQLTAADARLAVTETTTASPRLQRQRDHEMSWKLGFDAWRRAVGEAADYQPFKPVPSAWFRQGFDLFIERMAQREGLALPAGCNTQRFEQQGWQRQREVMRLSVVRSAFRRAIEVWLVLDLACELERSGYTVEVGQFCARALTPRNLLISAC